MGVRSEEMQLRNFVWLVKFFPWVGLRRFLSCRIQLLVERQGMPGTMQVMRHKPLPEWLVETIKQGKGEGRGWFHVYLDNFFSGEKVVRGEEQKIAEHLQAEVEQAWNRAGVLSSEKKKVTGREQVQELGAQFDGDARLLGVSSSRLLRLFQTTCVLLSKRRFPRKWLQVVLGRWVHVLQFRRAGMASLHRVWKWLSNKKISCSQYLRARRELATLLLGSCLFHTFLGASVSNTATVSDASGKGGAVGQSTKLTEEGQDFVRALTKTAEGCPRVPILVLSLFNGIGGAFRAYDLVGAEPAGLIGFDVTKPATRVPSRRWPHAVLKGDAREIDMKMVKGWLLQYPHVTQVDVWAGFPCVDLSAVKLGRLNLRGEHSGLFSEVLRVLDLLRQVFGRRFKIYSYG